MMRYEIKGGSFPVVICSLENGETMITECASRPCPSTMWPTPFVPTSPTAVIDSMEDMEKEKLFSLWMNWEIMVISFSPDEGFEDLYFQTHEEKLRFAIDRGNEGFAIR